ncbi:hypothetical protein [Dyella agri]|uniref:Methyl-accepting chemotaxis protein n=1 Tax=Dyella agri TaxID=1926869 RepID=A0ABW8KJK2_9GAMM
MHLELPNTRLASLKDFARHYLMIVLSILTALGLEAWIEHTHHAHAAAEASQRMNSELHKVLDNIKQSTAMNKKNLAMLLALDTQVSADLKANLDNATINRKIQANRDNFLLNSNWPTMSSVAWDTALADQSAGWLDANALQRYSTAYTAEQELGTWLQHDSTLVLNAPHLVDTLTDLQTVHPVDPYDFLRSLKQMEMMLSSMVSHLDYAAKRIAPAVDGSAVSKPAST